MRATPSSPTETTTPCRMRSRVGLRTASGLGLFAGLVLALFLVLAETLLLRAWWSGNLVAPQALAQTRMFDFLVEVYSGLRAWLFATWMPDPLSSVYLPTWTGALRLAQDLVLVTLPAGAVIGLLVGWIPALAGKTVTAGSTIRRIVALGIACEMVGWLASLQLPVRYTYGALARVAVRNFLWDGVMISCLALLLAGALALAASRVLLPQPASGRSSQRGPLWIVLLAAGTWIISATSVSVPAGHASYQPPQLSPQPLDSKAPAPNLLIVSIDSLRADHLGCYAYRRNTSPRIDALANSGVLFTNAWSTTSWTLPAHVSLLSGRSLLGHGVMSARKIPASVPLLAELLRNAGYETAAFVSAPWLSSRFGFDRGFNLYDDFSVPFTPDRESRMRAQATVSAPLLEPAVETWLRKRAKPPFFMFLHYFDVHYDYQPPAPYDSMFDPDYDGPVTGKGFHADSRIRAGMNPRDLKHLLALYDGEIRFTDSYVGKVLDLLEELGFADQTLIVLTADHGDEFLEHGGKGHHRTLYEEVIHVPLIISWPGRLPAGTRIADPVSIMDVAPTILGALGLHPPADIEGVNLVPRMTDSSETLERSLVAELYVKQNLNLQVALRMENYKLIESLNFPERKFYDLASDPGEQSPSRGSAEVELTQKLASWMTLAWEHNRELSSEKSEVVLDQGRMEALRALGYIE